jgi:hypothetical protein
MGRRASTPGTPAGDWRDKAQYPDRDAPFRQFAWEFLRRNPAYRQAWASIVSDPRLYRLVCSDEEARRYEMAGFSLSEGATIGGDELDTRVPTLEREWAISPLADPARRDAWQALRFDATTLRR